MITSSSISIKPLQKENKQPLLNFYHQLTADSKRNFQPHPFDEASVDSICSTVSKNILYYSVTTFGSSDIVAYAIFKKGFIEHDIHRFQDYPIALSPRDYFSIALAFADDVSEQNRLQILTLLFKEIKKKGAKKIILWGGIHECNQSMLQLYLKSGFRILGEFNHHGKCFDLIKDFNDLLFENSDWLKDLIIYEINPYAFNIPNGEKYGTFSSVADKIEYLSDIGINSIWLAGYCEATDHFRGIPTVYATLRPDKIDPRLGSAEELKQLIAKAHKYNIRIFLDAITHGVTNDSSLIREHPDWFSGTSWGMTDYVYENNEFRKWYIETWTNYVLEFEVDGFRLDGPNGVQPWPNALQIWEEVIEKCAKHGKSVLIFPENMPYHFQQGLDETLDPKFKYDHNPVVRYSRIPRYKCRAISNHDYGIDRYAEKSYYQLWGSRYLLAYEYIFSYNIPIIMSGEEFNANYESLPGAHRELYGGNGGSSVWLYASKLNWDQTNEPEKQAFLNDFRKILHIKHENCDLLHYDRLNTKICKVEFTSNIFNAPVPYFRYDNKKAILVVGNNTLEHASFTLNIPVECINKSNALTCQVKDLWFNSTSEIAIEHLQNFTVDVLPDLRKNGGFRVFRIEFKD
jgi:hypothetical protein